MHTVAQHHMYECSVITQRQPVKALWKGLDVQLCINVFSCLTTRKCLKASW